ncbi:MbcA/ParS/Xre antitoxin family protein [Niveispirillum sp. BGYR6]|uniref:MbcA/ParS/Xre antitoxin family protein n=1 Tax=Niveispirillum sp. BGYR6 TaxID=2971249 RepID=UPI0022B994F6|nr:MbcA/ParS/Xre antitoxin family protein [Niveispirillum sp. BGYR6]MDG5497325.1 MbcA/ParS/Xre antitoxin family protein [Niveispirillum sp. BGYR6]
MQFAEVQSIAASPGQPLITDEEAAALARTTVNLFRAWELSDAEARTLLGGMAPRTWARWKDGDIGRIDRDLRARMAILMGIHKALRYLFTEPARAYAWVRKPNAAFAGQRALDIMLRGEITDLIDLRAYLDAERGGW